MTKTIVKIAVLCILVAGGQSLCLLLTLLAVPVAAGALADMGRIDEAIERLERLDLRPEGVQPHHLRVWYVLGDLLQKKGRFTQAREWFEAADSADPSGGGRPFVHSVCGGK